MRTNSILTPYKVRYFHVTPTPNSSLIKNRKDFLVLPKPFCIFALRTKMHGAHTHRDAGAFHVKIHQKTYTQKHDNRKS